MIQKSRQLGKQLSAFFGMFMAALTYKKLECSVKFHKRNIHLAFDILKGVVL
ncbi:hypothetical protein CHCC20335_1817 [Bacillus paralicheniformis]|nr:hypothetical protein CHCC20335_1817 [Bacillus paralicheniformis]